MCKPSANGNGCLQIVHFSVTNYVLLVFVVFQFTLCKHVRLSYVFLINLLTYLLTYLRNTVTDEPESHLPNELKISRVRYLKSVKNYN